MSGFEVLIPILAILVGGAIVLTPLVALCARFALRPILQAVAEVKGTSAANASATLQDRRMDLLEAEFQNLQSTVNRLVEVDDFRRQLEAGPEPSKNRDSLEALR